MGDVVHWIVSRPKNESAERIPRVRRYYTCRCGRPVFFRNSRCLGCGSPLGYDPVLGEIIPIEPAAEPDSWRLAGSPNEGTVYRRCANLDSASGCNWLLEAGDSSTSPQSLCKSCRLDRTIPDLSVPANAVAYQQISIAKRRLVSLLIGLDLPVASRLSEDPEHGLAFDFLRSPENGPRVITGHNAGIITLNIEEAEDATRERIREDMGEPYRTLLGHLRHETGHYYWGRLVAGTAWLPEFRRRFGDEQQPTYADALQNYYQQGPAPDWPQRFVSAYASSHPWEDWAETWAHYLHMADTYGAALSFGLDPEAALDLDVEPFRADALFRPEADGAGEFLDFVNSWTRLTAVMNELSRAMGLADFYPFVLSRAVVAKLHLVHLVVTSAAAETGPAS